MVNSEVLLRENAQRYSIFPIQYQDLWDLTKQSSNFFWLADLRTFSDDLNHWSSRLTASHRLAVELTFGSFLHCDVEINLKFVQNICEQIEATEAKIFFGNYIHKNLNQMEAYRLFLLNVKNNENEVVSIKKQLKKIKTFDEKSAWALRFFEDGGDGNDGDDGDDGGDSGDNNKDKSANETVTFGEKVVAMIAIVAVFSTFTYNAMLSFEKLNSMPGIVKIHEHILKDKQYLLNFCFRIYDYVGRKPSQSRIKQIVSEAIDLEQKLIAHLFIESRIVPCSEHDLRKAFEDLKDAILNMFYSSNSIDLKTLISESSFGLAMAPRLTATLNFSPNKEKFHVIKRNGSKEFVHFDKITSRIKKLCYGLDMEVIDPGFVTYQVIGSLKMGIRTCELDDLAAGVAAKLSNENYQYGVLAARIAVSNLHKETKKQFSDVIDQMYEEQHLTEVNTISADFYSVVVENAEQLNSCIIYDRDFYLTYENFKILERRYLFRVRDKIIERPQQMFLRVAIGIHGNDIPSVIKTYNLISERSVMFSAAILKSAGMIDATLLSSASIAMKDDSIEGIFDTLENVRVVLDDKVPLGLHLQCIRSKGSLIRGTNGSSNGVVPLLRNFNEMVSKESNMCCTVYLEAWHSDFFDFLELKELSGVEELRATNLNYAIWMPDLFMERLENDQMWSFMCPNECKQLTKTWGRDFETLYEQYENKGMFRFQKAAKEVWRVIINSQMETASPAILFKDTCNRKSNQQHMGTIQGGNGDGDIIQYSSKEMIGVVFQAVVLLSEFVKEQKFDFHALKDAVHHLTKCLDLVIEKNSYSLPEQESSALETRAIAIGAQGLADVFLKMRYTFDSESAKNLNSQIFETIYYGALEASCELAAQLEPYELYANSSIAQGQLQMDMCGFATDDSLWPWSDLRNRISKFGVRNSLLVSVLKSNEIFSIFGHHAAAEPFTSLISETSFKKDKFKLINRYLIEDLMKLNLWDKKMKEKIMNQKNGSIQKIDDIPTELKQLYKTAWEIEPETLLDLAADRARFVDHSEAVTLYVQDAAQLSALQVRAWKSGLKTAASHISRA